MTETARQGPMPRAALVLWFEFLVLYVAIPLAMAFLLPASAMWPMLGGALIFAVVMLHRSPDFRWRDAFALPGRRDWARIGGFALLVTALSFALVWWLRPGALLSLPRYRFDLWLMIMALYPILSALPQEVIWRSLFFTRYARLFPGQGTAVAVNAAAFGLVHLFFWNSVAIAMTAAGGVIFAQAYLAAGPRRGLITATLMHAVAGWALFTAGLGTFFYHGAVAP